jgi:hypothetical protein
MFSFTLPMLAFGFYDESRWAFRGGLSGEFTGSLLQSL